MKKMKKIKRIGAILLIFLLNINSFATSISDNDGSAFITKAEFDALKSSFQAQIDTYNQGIDSKIDAAIASYLSGVALNPKKTKSIIYSTVSPNKVTCVTDWSELSLVPPTSGIQAFCVGTGPCRWSDKNGGVIYKLWFDKPITNDGKMIVCNLINNHNDGTYDALSWKGWYKDCNSNITKVGLLKENNTGSCGFNSWSKATHTNWCPLLATGFYDNYNEENNFFNMQEVLYFGSDGVTQNWNDVSKFNYLNQSISIGRTKDVDNYVDVISYNNGINIEIGVDDNRFLWVPSSKGLTKETWTKSATKRTYRYANQGKASGGGSKEFSGNNNWGSFGSGYMPVYGCLGEKQVDNILLVYNNIETEETTLNQIYLTNGIPVFEGKKGDEIEWEINMVDSDDYQFCFSYERFLGEPVPSNLINCTIKINTIETIVPEVLNGHGTIKFTMSEDGVVWAKWRNKNSLQNAVLDLPNSKSYIVKSES